MKQIYDFEQYEPPVLHENILKSRQKDRRQKGQLLLSVTAGILLQLLVLLLGWTAVDWYPALSALCFGYVVVSATGGGVIAVVWAGKGGRAL